MLAVVALAAAACTGAPRTGTHAFTAGSRSAAAPGASTGAAGRVQLEISRMSFRLPEPVQREVAVEVGGSVLVAGGLGPSGSSTDAVVRIDPSSGSVQAVGAVPTPFHDGAGAVVGGRLLVFGGGQVEGTDVVQSVAPSGAGGALVGRLPDPVSDLGAATVGRTVVLVGGFDGSRFLPTVLATTDGRRFRQVATLPVGLRYAAVAPVPGGVVVAGGLSSAGPVRTVLRVAIPGGAVSRLAALPRPLTHAAAVGLGGVVVVLGGEDATGRTVASVERIDIRTGTVTAMRPLPGTVADAAAVATGPAEALLIGGRRGPEGHDVALATILRIRLVR